MTRLSLSLLCSLTCSTALLLTPPVHAQSAPPPDSSESVSRNARTPTQWLQNMATALNETSFRGRSIYLSGDQLTSVEILHGIVDGEPWERVVHLSGEPAEILRKGDRVACLHPESVSELKDFRGGANFKAATVPTAASFPRQWNTTQYRLNDGPDDRIAGRSAKRIDILPVDRYRHGLHLWLDKETSLLLKSVIVDQRGRALDMFEFVSIETGVPLKAEDFEPANGLQWNAKAEDKIEVPEAVSHWQPGWLPVGFIVSSHVLRPTASAIFAQSYSDGLAAFTLFVEPLTTGDEMEGSRQHGATVAVSYRAPLPNENFRVTVVGEIPLETAMQVASSIQRKSP